MISPENQQLINAIAEAGRPGYADAVARAFAEYEIEISVLEGKLNGFVIPVAGVTEVPLAPETPVVEEATLRYAQGGTP
jgi:hypothetical protein